MESNKRTAHEVYIDVIRSMAPADRLRKAFELTELTRRLFKQGLRERFPEKTDDEIHRIYLERLAECHNQNY